MSKSLERRKLESELEKRVMRLRQRYLVERQTLIDLGEEMDGITLARLKEIVDLVRACLQLGKEFTFRSLKDLGEYWMKITRVTADEGGLEIEFAVVHGPEPETGHPNAQKVTAPIVEHVNLKSPKGRHALRSLFVGTGVEPGEGFGSTREVDVVDLIDKEVGVRVWLRDDAPSIRYVLDGDGEPMGGEEAS